MSWFSSCVVTTRGRVCEVSAGIVGWGWGITPRTQILLMFRIFFIWLFLLHPLPPTLLHLVLKHNPVCWTATIGRGFETRWRLGQITSLPPLPLAHYVPEGISLHLMDLKFSCHVLCTAQHWTSSFCEFRATKPSGHLTWLNGLSFMKCPLSRAWSSSYLFGYFPSSWQAHLLPANHEILYCFQAPSRALFFFHTGRCPGQSHSCVWH